MNTTARPPGALASVFSREAVVVSRGWLVILPIAVLFLHGAIFGAWIIDDAAISFAYARNLATGNGLVSQPGLPPVEGYSNSTWVLLMAPFFALDVFDPVVTPKIVSAVCLALAYGLLYHTLEYRRSVLVALGLLSLNTSFVVWSFSGLENPLNVALAALLFWSLARQRGGAAGVIAALLALTRPDGLAYFFVYPFLVGFRVMVRRGLPRYLFNYALVFGGFLLFRWQYFGQLLPNTAVAKGTLTLSEIGKLVEPFQALAGAAGGLLVVALAVVTIGLVVRRRFNRLLWTALLCTGCAWAIFALLPEDWMSEYRFATNAWLFLYLYAALLADRLPLRPRLAFAAAAVVACLVGFISRTPVLSQRPNVPFQRIYDQSVALGQYADRLGIGEASILAPDAGGFIYHNRFEFIDLAGLLDRQVATIFRTAYPFPALYEAVLEERRPTFMLIRGVWTMRTRLDDDPRFRRDYLPIYECIDSYPLAITGERLMAGLYVRKEAISRLAIGTDPTFASFFNCAPEASPMR